MSTCHQWPSPPHVLIIPGLGELSYYYVLIDSILWVVASLLVILGAWRKWKWLLLPKLILMPFQLFLFLVGDL